MVQASFLEKRLPHPAFSLCFGHDGGYLTLGKYNASRHLEGAQPEQLRFDRSQGQYRVTLLSIFVPARHQVDQLDTGRSPAELNQEQGVFFDSGTTLFHAPYFVLE